MLNLNKLEIFATVVRTGSFSAAAQQLLMTQPAVSQHIHDLEASLGTRLFERGRRGVTLTPAGTQLHEYTRAIFELVAQAENAITDVGNLAAGQMQIGATPGISVYLLPDPIQQFHSRYPKLQVSVQTGITPQILEDLRLGKLDLGLIEGELDAAVDTVLGVQMLDVVEQWVVVGPQHPWWGRAEVAIAELNGQTFVLRQRHSQTRIWLEGVFQQHRLHPRIAAEFDNVESIKRTVINGTSITVLPDYAVQHEVEMGRLWLLHVAGRPLQRTLKVVWNRETYTSPVARAFLEYLQRYLPHLDVAGISGLG
jgi:LysR family transcriptional regulator, low CO2-responsive transcriptional regulator